MTEKFKEEIVLYIVYKAIKEYGYEKIDRLQVVKILYLIDKLLKERNGSKVTAYNYIHERLGPYDQTIVMDLTKFVKLGKLINTGSYYEYVLCDNFDVKDLEKFKEIDNMIMNDTEIKNQIISIFELGRNVTALLDFVHSLKEVKDTPFRKVVL